MGAPQARLSDMACRLRNLGHDVLVLTAMPNYPTGKVFPGYKGFSVSEEIQGIQIYRTWIIPSKSTSLIHRLVSYLSFCISSLIIGLWKIGNMDFIFTESPPLFLGYTGLILSKIKRARWIMNVSDLWPDSGKYIGIFNESSLVYRLLEKMAHFLYKKAWLVTGQSTGIINEIHDQVRSAKVYHLSNGVDLIKFNPSKKNIIVRQKFLKENYIGIVYAGLHGLFQGLDQVLMVAKKLEGKPIRFVFFGDGPAKESLISKSNELGLTNVDFNPPLSQEEISKILPSMDIAVISLKSNIKGAVPSKIYEAMGSGVPILLIAGGEPADIVKQARAGTVVDTSDIDTIAEAVSELVENNHIRKTMGYNGRLAAENLYDRSKITACFEAFLMNSIKE
jgi:glycosyltransferase involved in cell wall biosynthesis